MTPRSTSLAFWVVNVPPSSRLNELECTPGRPISRILSSGWVSSCEDGSRLDGHPSWPVIADRLQQPTRDRNGPFHLSLLGLAPSGGYLAAVIAGCAGGLLPHLFTLAAYRPEAACGTMSLWPDPAAKLANKPAAPDVLRRRALWSADFPLAAGASASRQRPSSQPGVCLSYHIQAAKKKYN